MKHTITQKFTVTWTINPALNCTVVGQQIADMRRPIQMNRSLITKKTYQSQQIV